MSASQASGGPCSLLETSPAEEGSRPPGTRASRSSDSSLAWPQLPGHLHGRVHGAGVQPEQQRGESPRRDTLGRGLHSERRLRCPGGWPWAQVPKMAFHWLTRLPDPNAPEAAGLWMPICGLHPSSAHAWDHSGAGSPGPVCRSVCSPSHGKQLSHGHRLDARAWSRQSTTTRHRARSPSAGEWKTGTCRSSKSAPPGPSESTTHSKWLSSMMLRPPTAAEDKGPTRVRIPGNAGP